MATPPRSQRLKIIVDLAQREEEHAASQLEAAQKERATEQSKLNDLAEYYASYEQQFSARNSGIRAEELGRSRDFLCKLKDAQTAQSIQLERSVEIEAECKRQWQILHIKKDRLADFVERCKNDERALDDKQEQKLLDDWINTAKRPF